VVLLEKRRASRRQAAKRQAVTIRKTNFFGQAFHGPQIRRGAERIASRALQVVKAANGDAHIPIPVNGETKTFHRRKSAR